MRQFGDIVDRSTMTNDARGGAEEMKDEREGYPRRSTTIFFTLASECQPRSAFRRSINTSSPPSSIPGIFAHIDGQAETILSCESPLMPSLTRGSVSAGGPLHSSPGPDLGGFAHLSFMGNLRFA